MANYALFISVLTSVFIYSTGTDVTTPDGSLQEHVQRLDEMLAEIQSHSQAQEQKYAAVLSSLLSQLTQTTDELEDLKSSQNETNLKLEQRDAEFVKLWGSHNETILKLGQKHDELSKLLAIHNATLLNLDNKEAELSKLWANSNATIRNLVDKNADLSKLWAGQHAAVLELHKLRAKDNDVLVDLKETVSNLEDFGKRLSLNGKIGFYGIVEKGTNVTANTTIFFDRMWYNNGETYNRTTGNVIIPINGTYQVWIDVTYQRPGHVIFKIQRNGQTIDYVYGSTSDATAVSVSMLYLHKGESIWVTASQSIHKQLSTNGVCYDAVGHSLNIKGSATRLFQTEKHLQLVYSHGLSMLNKGNKWILNIRDLRDSIYQDYEYEDHPVPAHKT